MSTLTLRPNAAGALTQCTPSAGANYACVYEAVADEDTTYVYTTTAGSTYITDQYALPNHTTETDPISKVTIYCRARKKVAAGTASLWLGCYTNSSYYATSKGALTASWNTYSQVYTVNPKTLAAWTWTEIDALQTRLRLIISNINCEDARVTQVYVEVDHAVVTSSAFFQLF